MAVTYQYPNELEQTVDGDDFELLEDWSQAGARIWGYGYDSTTGNEPIIWRSRYLINVLCQQITTQFLDFRPRGFNPEYEERWILDIPQNGTSVYEGRQVVFVYRGEHVDIETYLGWLNGRPISTTTKSLIHFDKFYNQPEKTKYVNLTQEYVEVTGTISYTLNIFKDGVQVFTRTSTDKPTVAIVETNQCPENTCEVDCGTHVCCYGSDGIAVFSYDK